ncbi:unnamed protein product, partial [Mesorhabditis spiculigera]
MSGLTPAASSSDAELQQLATEETRNFRGSEAGATDTAIANKRQDIVQKAQDVVADPGAVPELREVKTDVPEEIIRKAEEQPQGSMYQIESQLEVFEGPGEIVEPGEETPVQKETGRQEENREEIARQTGGKYAFLFWNINTLKRDTSENSAWALLKGLLSSTGNPILMCFLCEVHQEPNELGQHAAEAREIGYKMVIPRVEYLNGDPSAEKCRNLVLLRHDVATDIEGVTTIEFLHERIKTDRLTYLAHDEVLYIFIHRQTRGGNKTEVRADRLIAEKLRDLVRGRNHVLFFGDFNTGYIDWERLVNSDRRTAPRAQSIMELMGDLGFTREWVREPTREGMCLDLLFSRQNGGAPYGVQPTGKCHVMEANGSDHKICFFGIIKEKPWHIKTKPLYQFNIGVTNGSPALRTYDLKIHNMADSEISLNIRNTSIHGFKMRFYDKVLDKEPIREPQQNFTIEAKQYHLIKLEFIDEPRQISAGTDPDWIILTNAKTYEEHHIRLRYYSAPAVAT